MKRVILFEKERETKRMIRYREVPEPQMGPVVIGTLYVNKAFAGAQDELVVTIEYVHREST